MDFYCGQSRKKRQMYSLCSGETWHYVSDSMVQFMYTRKFLEGTTQRGETGKKGVYVLFYNWGWGAVCYLPFLIISICCESIAIFGGQ